jgi:transcriptional regulator with XRE-family HTH domain
MKPENKFIRDLGKRIKELRESKGWSQERLALEADVDNSHLGKLERGEGNPTLKLVFRIAQSLNVDFRDLLD